MMNKKLIALFVAIATVGAISAYGDMENTGSFTGEAVETPGNMGSMEGRNAQRRNGATGRPIGGRITSTTGGEVGRTRGEGTGETTGTAKNELLAD
jgi:hypothetical protein